MLRSKPLWVRITILALAVLTTTLLVTPKIIEHFAVKWFYENSGEQIIVRNVDFNPFTGVLLFEGLEVRVKDEFPLAFDTVKLDLAWIPLLKKRIAIQGIKLAGFHILVQNQDILRIGGILLPTADEKQSVTREVVEHEVAWLSGIDTLTIKDFSLVYQDKKLTSRVYIEKLHLSDLMQWTPEKAAKLDLAGTINDARIEINAELKPFAEVPFYAGTLTLEKMPLGNFASLLDPVLDKFTGMVSLQGAMRLKLSDDTFHLVHDGRLALHDIKLGHAAAYLSNSDSAWKGNVDLHIRPAAAETRLRTQGKLEIGKLTASLTEKKLRYTQKSFALGGDFLFSDDTKQQDIGLRGDIVITGPDLTLQNREVSLLNAGQFHISQLKLNSIDDITAKEITVDNLALGQRLSSSGSGKSIDAFLHAKKIRFSDFSRKGNFISIDVFEEQNVDAQYRRDRKGNWYMMSVVGVLLGEEDNTSQTEKKKSANGKDREKSGSEVAPAPTRLAINRIEVSKGSTLSIIDEAVTPPFLAKMTLNKLSLKKIDTGKPRQASLLQLEGKIGKHARLSVNGTIKPFLSPVGLDLQGKLYAVDLPELSPYTRNTLGVVLDSGTLDADLQVMSEDKIMEGKAVLKLHQLVLETVDSKSSLQSKIPVPLDVALDTLRDKDNTIELEIPIQGDAADPSFDVSDAISQAVATGISAGAVSYLSMVLQPFGSLITVVQYAGDSIARVQLDPVQFDSGQAVLDDTDREYLARVAKMLKERPKLAIKVCGVAVQQDVLFYQGHRDTAKAEKTPGKSTVKLSENDVQHLKSLSKQRAENVKDYLIESLQAPANRLVGCRPRLETSEIVAVPRTDLLI